MRKEEMQAKGKRPRRPSREVAEEQDPEHTEADFFRDLDKATSNQARKKLGLPPKRD
jgi:hypothetical protein